jgi:hypothetical protein
VAAVAAAAAAAGSGVTGAAAAAAAAHGPLRGTPGASPSASVPDGKDPGAD